MDDPFAAFVRAHSRSLFGTAYLLTGSGHAAEELLQDTLAALYPKWTKVQAAEQPLAYVRRALSNRFVSTTRRPAARDVAVWQLPDAAAPGDLAESVAERRWLWQALAGLPERQRAALVLRYFHDLPDDEIAASLDCRVGTVRSLISRGLASIRSDSFADPSTATMGGGR
ncbi:MAG: SigE family RNA polymerase sigma factor [Jatrophihabitans sp.]|uniref:SigE family RNA polymerase sigma factor n=1 Tax=Jatrophihabitans sp. TaxID=1932789 RepID=UPI003F7DD8F1